MFTSLKSVTRPSGEIGRHATSGRRADWHGSSSLPLVTDIADAAGAQPAFIRPPARFDTGVCNLTRVGQCSVGLISSARRVRLPDPPLTAEYAILAKRPATTAARGARSLVILWVRPPPRSLDPWSNGENAWVTTRQAIVQLGHRPQRGPGSFTRSVGVLAAHLLGRQGDRVQFPDGPLGTTWVAGQTERHLPCKQEIGVRLPGGPLTDTEGIRTAQEPGC